MQVGIGASFIGLRIRGTAHTNTGINLNAQVGLQKDSQPTALGVQLNYNVEPQTTQVLNVE